MDGMKRKEISNPLRGSEDMHIGLDKQGTNAVLNFKRMRDLLVASKKEKVKLIKSNYTPEIDLKSGDETISIKCEILQMLSSIDDINFRKKLLHVIPVIFSYIKKLRKPFSRYDISILRSFKNIVHHINFDIVENKMVFSILEIIKIQKDEPNVHACKNEAILVLLNNIKNRKLRKLISNRRFMSIFSSPKLNSLKLVSRIISESNVKFVKIRKIMDNLNFYDESNKKSAFSCCIKWYKMSHKSDPEIYKKLVDIFKENIAVDKECLIYLGKIAENNIVIQNYCNKLNIIEIIAEKYENNLSSEVIYSLYSLTSILEENRKNLSNKLIIKNIFELFKNKILLSEFDYEFVAILYLFRSMTRSVLFLRSDLLKYPIVELLFESLSKMKNCNIDDIDDPREIQKNEYAPSTNLYFNSDHTGGFIIQNILNVMINLVMEYGNYKQKFMSSDGIRKVEEYREEYPIHVLQIYKNFLYDTNSLKKEYFIKNTDRVFFNCFFNIFENTKNFKILEVLFNLIRNLVCDDSIDAILASYDGLMHQIFKYLEYFANFSYVKVDSIYEKVLIQIFYTIGNLSVNSISFRDILLDTNRLIFIKNLSTTRELQLAFIWIIINVSWKDKGYEERIEELKKIKIKDFLTNIDAQDPVLIDKINTALENLK